MATLLPKIPSNFLKIEISEEKNTAKNQKIFKGKNFQISNDEFKKMLKESFENLEKSAADFCDEIDRPENLKFSNCFCGKSPAAVGKRTKSAIVFKFSAFKNEIFKFLRNEIFQVTEKNFFKSLKKIVGGQKEKSGKSGSTFWFSEDKRFVLKSVTTAEFFSLTKILKNYVKFLKSHRNSFLCKFFGIFGIFVGNGVFRFVVMENVLFGCRANFIFDLKGTTEDRFVKQKTEKNLTVLKDLNFKGKKILLADEIFCSEIKKAIFLDTMFLSKWGVMDYSLLVGVEILGIAAADKSPQEKRGLKRQESFHSLNSENFSWESRSFEVFFTLEGGEEVRVRFFLGLIDTLQGFFNLKKMSAHFIKKATIGLFQEIDTEPPRYYKARFDRFIDDVVTFKDFPPKIDGK